MLKYVSRTSAEICTSMKEQQPSYYVDVICKLKKITKNVGNLNY